MTRTGDWVMPATVQGQLSGCGAAYQSGGRLCVEAALVERRAARGCTPSRISSNADAQSVEAAQANKEME